MWSRDLLKSLATDYEDDLARGYEEMTKAITMKTLQMQKCSMSGQMRNNACCMLSQISMGRGGVYVASLGRRGGYACNSPSMTSQGRRES